MRCNAPKRGDSNGSRRDEMLPKCCLIPPHRFGLAHVAVDWPTGEALASDGRAVSAWLESLAVASQLASLYLWLSQ